MATAITAQQVAGRITRALGVPKPPGSADGFLAGNAETAVTGIATTFVPSFEVLRKAAANGRNFIVCRESPFWNRAPRALAGNPVFEQKQDFIARNGFVVCRLRDAWDAHTADWQVLGLKRALGWEQQPGRFFAVTKTRLQALAMDISKRLNIHAARIIGDPGTPISKVALSHGLISTPQIAAALSESGAEAVIIGEPVEWQASPYFQDVIASGQKRGLIVLGHAASEEPGCAAMAAWLKPLVTEVDVEWIRAGDPFQPERWS